MLRPWTIGSKIPFTPQRWQIYPCASLLYLALVTIRNKIPFTSKCGRFSEKNVLRYFSFIQCYPAYHKLKIFPLLKAVNPLEAWRIFFFFKSATFGVKGILLAMVHLAYHTCLTQSSSKVRHSDVLYMCTQKEHIYAHSVCNSRSYICKWWIKIVKDGLKL